MNEGEIFRTIMRTDFASFAKRAMAELAPSLDLQWNWHLDLMADRLQQLAEGSIQRLVINVPPRSLKSQLCSVIYVAWLLGNNPHLEIICMSYAQSLGEDFSRQSRKLMESHFYRRVFDTRLSRDKRAVDQFETTDGGRRITSSVGGTVTGRGGDFIILDDPMKPEEAMSETGRKSTLDWIQGTLVSRPNSKKTSRMLVVMQRLHEEDVTAELIRQGGWEIINLPAIATEREEHHYKTALGPQCHVRLPGEPLHPEREDLPVLHQVQAQMGSLTFSAQYQQQPMPAEGNLLKRIWIRRYGPADIINPDMVVQSWDTASKIGQLNDYSVGTTWAVKGPNIFLLHVFRERAELPALQRQIIEHADRYGAQTVLIENQGSGTGLLQGLSASYFYKAVPVQPKGAKILRFHGITPMFEAGHVHLPEHAPWLDDFVHELCGFPSVKYDDQVDSTSQALAWIRERNTTPGIIEYYRQEVEAKLAFSENRTVHLRAPHGVSRAGMLDGHYLPVDVDGTIWVTGENAASLRRAGFVQLNSETFRE